MDLATVDHLLTSTRTVRKRLDTARPVDPDVICECLRLAVQAPTGSNLQGWRWMVVTDSKKRAAVADIYRRAIGPYLDFGKAALDPSNKQMVRVVESSFYLVDVLADIPVHIIPCVLNRPEDAGRLLGGMGYDVDPWCNVGASGFYGSIWPAVWSLMLALRSRGLGSALTTMHLALEHEVGELLGIPETVTQVGLLPVAYFTGEDFKPAKRRPPEEITYWDEWKNTTG
ncbi:MAG: nitroreductase family protein [Actinomycetota bacterium]